MDVQILRFRWLPFRRGATFGKSVSETASACRYCGTPSRNRYAWLVDFHPTDRTWENHAEWIPACGPACHDDALLNDVIISRCARTGAI